ncbi:hypothetical protein GALL_38120 [mine drainage metagenome]|uniref:Outer membrane protein beta-barrel domain-containing protein n=1 Tax=mine drainage metagenome TaxID=410659 RepID=A0A1J5T3M9_9ZZZZ
MKKQILFAAVMAAISAPAFAGADVEAHVSTLGLGLGMGFQATDTIVARIGFNEFNKNFSTSSGTLNYDGKLKLSSLDALLDWHLFGGATHLTAGIMSNNNKFNLTATPSGGFYMINGTQYSASQVGTLNGDVSFNSVAPYLGFGWNSQPKNKGLEFKSDIGIMFQGSPKATLSYTGTQTSAISSQVAAEQANLNDKLKNYKYYPVISFGIGYAF